MHLKNKNIVLLLLFVFLSFGICSAQTKEFVIKAALVEKFSNYIEWPEKNNLTDLPNITVGLIGKTSFGEALKEIYKDVKLKGKDVIINNFSRKNKLDSQILIIGEMEESEFKSLYEQIKDKPILIITDIENYTEAGPHICFYLSEEGNVRFKFNKKTFDKTGLYVSHMLLRYAEIIE